MTDRRVTVEAVVDHGYRVLVDDGTDSADRRAELLRRLA